jgi:DNA polymerase delta subunit 1
MKSYGYFGRLKYSKSSIKKERYLSKAMGMRETHEIGIIGRIKLDMLIHMHG